MQTLSGSKISCLEIWEHIGLDQSNQMPYNAKKLYNRSCLPEDQAQKRLDKINSQSWQANQIGFGIYGNRLKEKIGFASQLGGFY